MRIIGKISSENDVKLFSYFLKDKGIDNSYEFDPAHEQFLVWIQEEDQVSEASVYLRQFKENPNDSQFKSTLAILQKIQQAKEKIGKGRENAKRFYEKENSSPIGRITLVIVCLAIILFIGNDLSQNKPLIGEPGVPYSFTYPINRSLMYDYPLHFQEIIEGYLNLNKENIHLSPTPKDTPPFWRGLYEMAKQYWVQGIIPLQTPVFEKISQGEIWRLFTPALLHANIFHIFFNLLWLIALGNQIEKRIGWLRYLLMVLILGIGSNTAQYLMSGFNAMGLSGIISGMVGFIWIRQLRSPWERYELSRPILYFLLFFILILAGLQSFIFIAQILDPSMQIRSFGIGNTSHVSGLIIGLFLGRFQYFGWQMHFIPKEKKKLSTE